MTDTAHEKQVHPPVMWKASWSTALKPKAVALLDRQATRRREHAVETILRVDATEDKTLEFQGSGKGLAVCNRRETENTVEDIGVVVPFRFSPWSDQKKSC